MTYGRVLTHSPCFTGRGATVSHRAELVRGNFEAGEKGPLIRPFGAPSPQGEKGLRGTGAAYQIRQATSLR
jgi:hypothetical protein